MPSLLTPMIMRWILTLGALVFACQAAPLDASSLRYRGALAPAVTVVADHETPVTPGGLPGVADPLRRVRSEGLPSTLAGYDGFGPLYAWGWRPQAMTDAQVDALTSWLAFGGVLLLPETAFEKPLLPGWLEELLPVKEHREQGACRQVGLGEVCPVRSNGDGAAPAEAWRARRSSSPYAWARGWTAPGAEIQRALNSRHRRRNPAGPLLLFSVVYALCVAWLSWRWFRTRGLEDRAWIGVLSLTCLFSAGAVAAGRLLAGGSRELQVAVLHGAPEAKLLRLTGWLARFSSGRERWRTELPQGVSTLWELQGKPARRQSLERQSVEGRSEPGQTSSFVFAGERRLEGRMRLELVGGDAGPKVRWSNETGLDFDQLWTVGSSAESGSAAPAGSRGMLQLDASDGRSFLPPPGWNVEEAGMIKTYLQVESARCPDCAFLASTRPEPGPAGRRLLYLWSVPRARDGARPPDRLPIGVRGWLE